MKVFGRPVLTARSLAILVAIVAIIVPTLVLSYFAFQWTHDIRARMDLLMDEHRQRAAREIEQALLDAALAYEESVMDEVLSIVPEQLPDALGALRANRPAVREVFLLDRNFRAIYPRFRSAGTAPMTAEDGGPRLDPARAILRQAEETEFANNSPENAIPLYEEFIAKTRWPRDQAAAALAIAGCLFKTQRYDKAAEQYNRALVNFNLAALDPSMSVLAAYQAALALEKAGEHATAAERYVALYEEIVDGRVSDPDENRVGFMRSRVAEALDRLEEHGNLPEALEARTARVRSRDQFLSDLKTWLVVKIRADVANAEGKRSFVHLSGDSPGPEPHLVAYTLLRRRGEKTWSTLLGFAYNLDALLTDILQPRLREEAQKIAPRYAIALETLDKKRLLGEELPQRTVTRRRMGALFPFWEIAVAERSSEYAEYYRKQLTVFHASINLVLVGVILAGVAMVIRDISRQQHLAQLQQEFVSNVSHEFKTPLALIRMFAEMLSMGRVRSPEKQQEYYQIMARESERLTHLINNVLDFSRIDAGRKQYSFRMANLTDLVRSTSEAYALTLRRQGFQVTIQTDNLPDMWIDPDAISQSLVNLLNNAFKYSGERKHISVELRRERGKAYLSVTDQGIGIEASEIPRIFEKFYRVNDPAVRETRGTGLGLSIVRHVARAHGGDVTVKSQKGVGSTFTIVLPIRTEPEEQEGANRPHSHAAKSEPSTRSSTPTHDAEHEELGQPSQADKADQPGEPSRPDHKGERSDQMQRSGRSENTDMRGRTV